MIKCKTNIGKTERNIIADTVLSFRKVKRGRIIGKAFFFCSAAFFLFFGMCGFLTEGMTSTVSKYLLCGIIAILLGAVLKPYQKALYKIKMKLKGKKQKNIPDDGSREYLFSDKESIHRFKYWKGIQISIASQ